MDPAAVVPEITTACWGILGKSPNDVMCANARMVVKRKGAARPAVVACTLLPYEQAFEMGETLAEASGPVQIGRTSGRERVSQSGEYRGVAVALKQKINYM